MQRVRRCERAGELRMERAAPGQPEQLGQRRAGAAARCARPQAAAAGAVCGVGASASIYGRGRTRPITAQMRVVLVLLIPLLLFSAWQYTRREENENRLALVASAVALRDVDVSCPGFWTRLVEITPNAGWVDFDEHGSPSDETSLSASTCAEPRAGLAREAALVRMSAHRRLRRADAGRRQRHRHARARVLAPARDRQRGADAVLRRPDGGGGRAQPRRRGEPTRGRLPCASPPRTRGRPRASTTPRTAGPGGAYDLRPETPAWPSS